MRYNTYVTSDWHLGHRLMDDHLDKVTRALIPGMRPKGWTELLLSNYRSQVEPHDTVYFLGDMVLRWGAEGRMWWDTIKQLPGRKILLRGNHDKGGLAKLQALGGFEQVWGEWHPYRQRCTGQDLLLSHVPKVPSPQFSAWRQRVQDEFVRGGYIANLHGHTHAHMTSDPACINVCVEVQDYALMLMDTEER